MLVGNQPVVSTRPALASVLGRQVLVADGAMGTMLQSADLSQADFLGYEGCNEILNISRPDVVASIHDAYLQVGADAIETNTFGANLANLAEYDIPEKIEELAGAAAKIARDCADRWSTPQHPRYVLASVGPGTRLPTLGHVGFPELRDAYQRQVASMLQEGIDGVLIETAQDLLQAKAAIIGARRAMAQLGLNVPILAQVTVETTGTMLLGSETLAAVTLLAGLRVDSIGMNCATGPVEMSEHLRQMSTSSALPITVMPNAGLPVLTADGSYYPLTPEELAKYLSQFVNEYSVSLVGGCCGTTPAHIEAIVAAIPNRDVRPRQAVTEPTVSSLYQAVALKQQGTYLTIGERANANGSKAFREALLDERFDDCLAIAKDQIREGAHVLDVCVDYVGRDGAKDMARISSDLATASTLPLVLDSTEPAVLEEGLNHLGAKAILNSVNYEDGAGPDSRFTRTMALVSEHGSAVIALTIDEEGQARTRENKVKIARRLIRQLHDGYGLSYSDILIDTLTFPIATGQEETRRDGLETLAAIEEIKAEFPDVLTVLGLSNVSFGLNPKARQVLNSVFLHMAQQKGLDAAIVHPSRILPLSRIPEDQQIAAEELILDKREYDAQGNLVKDPLVNYMALFADASQVSVDDTDEVQWQALPVEKRLNRRILEAKRKGLEDDLDLALASTKPLEIVNDVLLPAMREVGDLFGAGQMQLPFVLASAEVMKSAVAHLEPHMEKSDESGKGTMVLATVKGDVHDIGKNLVDIILTNNGYRVINLGIKQPINSIIEAAEVNGADAIGMSGLLVKSTVIMKENLQEIQQRGLAKKYPVVLGGAALTRAYVEDDLASMFEGHVRYAKDAFEGLALMDSIMSVKRGDVGASLPDLRPRRIKKSATVEPINEDTTRSDVAILGEVPNPPFLGSRVIKGLSLSDYASWLDERATFMGQWGLKASRGEGPTYEELVETEGRPRLRWWLDRIATESVLDAGVVYGFFPANSEGNEIVVYHHDGPNAGTERLRLKFPRQSRDRRLCLADYLKPVGSGPDYVGFHVVTMGSRIDEAAAAIFERNEYREYLELHGLSVQLTEALAEYWHSRVRIEWGIGAADAPSLNGILKQEYQGERFSFGYPACPDLSLQTSIMELLEPQRVGVSLSEEFQLHPEQSTSAIIFHHPEAAYFNAG